MEWASSRERVVRTAATLGPGPWPGEHLVALGWTRDSLRRAVEAGRLVRLRRSVYGLADADRRDAVEHRAELRQELTAELEAGLRPEHTARLTAERTAELGQSPPARAPDGRSRVVASPHDPATLQAFLHRVSSAAVVSHTSAARLHGLWLPRTADDLIHVTVPGEADRRDGRLRVHGSRLPSRFVTDRGELAVTSLARTFADVSRGGSLSDALIAGDSALRLLLGADDGDGAVGRSLRVSGPEIAALQRARESLWCAYASVWSWPGSRVVRAALELADPRSESAFESWSRGLFLDAGLPAPVLALAVTGRSRRRYFADFGWPSHRVLGEADGLAKYGTTLTVRDAVAAERRRQADLEASGWRVVRWTTRDNPAEIVRLVRGALAAAPHE